MEWFAKTRETKCNNQGVLKCITTKTKENLKKLLKIKRNTLKCVSRVFAKHSKAIGRSKQPTSSLYMVSNL